MTQDNKDTSEALERLKAEVEQKAGMKIRSAGRQHQQAEGRCQWRWQCGRWRHHGRNQHHGFEELRA